jgi:hypothetical protein
MPDMSCQTEGQQQALQLWWGLGHPSKPESIRIGMPMKAAFIHRLNTDVPETYLAFEPA